MNSQAGERIRNSHAFIDGMREQVAEANRRSGRTITCSKGCFHCCKEPVWAPRAEAQLIIESLTETERAELTVAIRRWFIQYRGAGFLTGPTPHVFQYRALNLWCPLLKDGLCSVYERRPVSCRLHWATGPVEGCSDDNQRKNQVFAVSPQIITESLRLAAGDERLETDNFGVMLYEELTGKKVESSQRTWLSVKDEGEAGHSTMTIEGIAGDGFDLTQEYP